MKVILNSDIRKVGKKYEVKDVANGYALNFLIPNGLAQVATDSSLKTLEIKKAEAERTSKVQEDLLMKNLKEVEGTKLELSLKANEKGHLFKAVHKEDIIEALKAEKHIDLSPEFLELEKPLKEVGEHKIDIKAGKAEATLTVVITPKA